jgi:hypothetical protein
MLDFYEWIYFELCSTLFAKSERRNKISSALAIITIIESWYFTDAAIAFTKFSGTEILGLRPLVILVGAAFLIANFAYLYPRHDRIQKKFTVDKPHKRFDLGIVIFFATPIIAAIILIFFLH